MLFGEISTNATVNYEQIVRNTLKTIGYDHSEKGLDYNTCEVIVAIDSQAQGSKINEDLLPREQGHVCGYATSETAEAMPLSSALACKLALRMSEVRRNGGCAWLRPDGKTQVTVEYRRELARIVPVRVHTIVISAQHDPDITAEDIQQQLKEHVIKHVVPAEYLDDKTVYHLNPSGRFVLGGPRADAGLTGKNIISDTYGGWGLHSGGGFSGKDPSKLERSGAYAARWVAKSLVKGGFCDRVSVQVSYAFGVALPLRIHIDSYGTVKNGKTDKELVKIVTRNFDLRPGVLIADLNLLRPIYTKTSVFGHFGREEEGEFPWEVAKDLSDEQ